MKKISLGLVLLSFFSTMQAEEIPSYLCSKEWFPGTDEEATMPSSTDDNSNTKTSKKKKPPSKTKQEQNVPQPKMNDKLSDDPSLLSPKMEKGIFPENNNP